MIRLTSGQRQNCQGTSRRDFLQVGALSFLGLTLPQLVQRRAEAASSQGNDVNCIFIFLWGGPSHHETFDPKPNAPEDIRSRYKAIPTSVDGVTICEHLPRLARMAKHYTLIRNLTHSQSLHPMGAHFALTGHNMAPGGTEYPNHGAVLARYLGPRQALPPFIRIGKVLIDQPIDPTGQGGGFLGSAHQPFGVVKPRDPIEKMAAFSLPEGVTPRRMGRRQRIFQALDELQADGETDRLRARDVAYERAFSLVTSPEAKGAFDLSQEPPKLREEYGDSDFGQGCLMARRLVSAGARLVQVNWSGHPVVDQGWDTHSATFGGSVHNLHKFHLPVLDQGVGTLIRDLADRGMLEKTLVVITGEFGRTPKVEPTGGRGHWPGVYSSIMLGAGIPGGRVIGESDPHGAYPETRGYSPEDRTVEIYRLLGMDTRQRLRRDLIVSTAAGIPELYG